VAVAIGMISPGPVVITATLRRLPGCRFWGSLVATIGIFLPSFLLVLIVAPGPRPLSRQPEPPGLHQGAYAAAIGTTSVRAVFSRGSRSEIGSRLSSRSRASQCSFATT